MLRPMSARPSGQRRSALGSSPDGRRSICALLAVVLAPCLAGAAPPEPSAADDAQRLLAAVSQRDTAALDALAESGPPATRALAAVARIHTLDDVAARRAAQDAGFIWRWELLEPLPGTRRGLDRISAPLADWIAGRAAAPYGGVLGPTAWRPAGPEARFGLLDLAASTADVPGQRMARAAFRLGDGGTVIAWVYSATPWRLWADGSAVGGGWGEPTLRTAEPVLLNLGPGAHRVLAVTAGDGAALALRLATSDGRPIAVEPLDGRNGPHGVSLGPLPGKPTLLADPLAGHRVQTLPPALAPRSGIAEATPEERRRRSKHAPLLAPLWRRIAVESDGAAALDAWRRVAALDPLDLDARFRADPTAWPAPERAPEGARRPPPAGFDGPLWWALADHRVEVGLSGTLLEQHVQAVHIRRTEGAEAVPWPPPDADGASCSVLRGPWVHPLRCADRAALVVGDVLVIAWRRGRRAAASVIRPPPAPFGRWSVRVEASARAPLRIEAPDGTRVEREGERRIWSLDARTSADGAVAVGTLVDADGLARALDRSVPPHPPRRVPEPGRRAAVLGEALRVSSTVGDPLLAARTLVERLAEAGEVADPVFARPLGVEPGRLPDPGNWPAPLIALGEQILDPRHPAGARAARLQGAPALRIGPDGAARPITLPVDPPAAHALTVVGELRLAGPGDVFFAATSTRVGRAPPLVPQLTAATEVLESTPTRVAMRRRSAEPLYPLPGWPDGARPGPHRITVELDVRAPAGHRAPPDVDLQDADGGYRRRSTPTADGWRTVRTFEWRSNAIAGGAFTDAVRVAESGPLILGGGGGGGDE